MLTFMLKCSASDNSESSWSSNVKFPSPLVTFHLMEQDKVLDSIFEIVHGTLLDPLPTTIKPHSVSSLDIKHF
jgi:hypothetical protein